MSEIKTRAINAWKAFSVQALVSLGSMPVWYPAVSKAATAAFGPNAEAYLQAALAAAGILGWIKPQGNLSNVQATDKRTATSRRRKD